MAHKLSAISLFSGAGGMDVGFTAAGFDVVYANELNRHAHSTYVSNFGNHAVLGDVYSQLDHLSTLRGVDCVFGGPPCQGFSVAGKMDLDDERSKLVRVFMDVVRVVRPKLFVMENVKGLASLSKFSNVRQELFRLAHTAGYSCDLAVLNSKDFGVPQARERMFFVGIMGERSIRLSSRSKKYVRAEISTRAAIEHLGPQGSQGNPKTCNAEVTLAANPVLRKSPYAGMLFNGLGRPLNPNKPCATLPASMGGNKTPIIDEEHYYGTGESWVEAYHAHLMDGNAPYDWKSTPSFIRRLTLNEAKVLHTFPESFIFKGPVSSIYTQIGNAVPCKLAEAVARSMKDALSDQEKSERIDERQLTLV